jgi:uncharacterized repeat protein (TIGR03803 family)
MRPFSDWKAFSAFSALLFASVNFSSAQTFTSLASFNNKNGSYPQAPLVQGFDGNLYGTTDDGGLRKSGTIFKVSLSGALSTVHYFCSRTNCSDGQVPESGLVLGTTGNLFGVTSSGGTGCSYCGTVFMVTPPGTLFTLHAFDGSDGLNPLGLLQSDKGNFYGITSAGGPGSGGTIFEMTPNGTLTTLYSFEDFDYPVAGLVQGADDNFYGTTITYAAGADGSVFQMTPAGIVTTLHTFSGMDGSWPVASLVQGPNGNFYGTTAQGGPESSVCVETGCGTVFEITTTGQLNTLHFFSGPDGLSPNGALVLGTDGNFYGTTSQGGPDNPKCQFGCGTIFQITPDGTFKTLHNFSGADGEYPYIGLVQASDGNFYGTTYVGGTSKACPSGCGTVFQLSMGLSPFVTSVPSYGWWGRRVKILGANLTGATQVTFNGKPATFTVVSPTEILTNVPQCATPGKIQVVTPGGTFTSNVDFHAVP